MITTQVVAEVRRVLRGDSDRALVHAVDGAGLEYKLEVPLDQVRALSSEQGHAIAITYAIHTLPGLAPPAADLLDPLMPSPSPAPTPTPGAPASTAGAGASARDPASVDADFMALMSRRAAPAGAPATAPAGPLGSPQPPVGGPTPTADPSLDAMVDELLRS